MTARPARSRNQDTLAGVRRLWPSLMLLLSVGVLAATFTWKVWVLAPPGSAKTTVAV